MPTLEELRREIDDVDSELLPLFLKRMELARNVASFKMKANLPVLNAARESEILKKRADACREEWQRPYAAEFFKAVMALSRAEQQKMLDERKESAPENHA
ncbi:MAG: chorismate mutase [Eubacteriales bacterium]|nr:chorismate mutase [Eubacteriales bacterium]MDD3881629.1 chorismate mutase [Eubacteriales bacterium]MDD4512312.1 chorismate mutase [Eubacteriales bacterium]